MTLDVAVYTEEKFHGDCSETFLIGESVDSSVRLSLLKTIFFSNFSKCLSLRRLLSVAKECLYVGISTCGPKVPFASIGSAIKNHAKKRKLFIIPYVIGHGTGTFFHGPPDIYHTLNNYAGVMKPGMIFTIEPCLSEGGTSLVLLEDKITYSTRDGSRTAQCEHTVLITDYGTEILSI